MAADITTLQAKRKAALKKMGQSLIFSKQRREYEKQANAYAKQIRAAKKETRKANKGLKGKGGWANYGPPEKLWSSDPATRKVGGWGVVSSITDAGFMDALVAIARGARTSVAARALEDRATIRGGIAALNAAGLTTVSPDSLKSQVTLSKKDDAALAKAAGAKTVREGAEKMRKRVAKEKLQKLAWAARGMYILANTKLMIVSKQMAGSILTAIPNPITMIIGAVQSVHATVSDANVKKATNEFNAMIKQETERLSISREEATTPIAKTIERDAEAAKATIPAPVNPWIVGGIAAALAATLAVVLSRRSAA